MKSWYESKTLWVNVVALVAAIVQAATGTQIIGVNEQAGLLAIANIVLRAITKTGITFEG